MRKFIILGLSLFFVIQPAHSTRIEDEKRFHLVIRLQDDPNGPDWRRKLIQQAQAPLNPAQPYTVVPLDEIANALGLSDEHFNLDYFLATYGHKTVKDVYASGSLKNAFGPEYDQLKRYLQKQDPQSTSMRMPIGNYKAYPPELNNFTRLQTLSFFSYQAIGFTFQKDESSDPNDHSTYLAARAALKQMNEFSLQPTARRFPGGKPRYNMHKRLPAPQGMCRLSPKGMSEKSAQLPTLKAADIKLAQENTYPPIEFFTLFSTHPILQNVKDLTFEPMTIYGFPEGWSNGLRNIKNLGFRYTPNNSVYPELMNLAGLESLTIVESVSSIPLNIAELGNLTRLLLPYNNIVTFPESFGQIVTLTELDLTVNSENTALQPMPGVLAKLTRLRVLNLSYNAFTANAFPFECRPGVLPSLTSLDMQFNLLGSLPEGISYLTNLRCLKLEGNPIGILPDSILKMTSLAHMQVNAWAQEMCDQLYQMTQLTTLDLGQTPYYYKGLSRLTNLTDLTLGYGYWSWSEGVPLNDLKLIQNFHLYVFKAPAPNWVESFPKLKKFKWDTVNFELNNYFNLSGCTNLENISCWFYVPISTQPEGIYPWSTIRVLEINSPVEVSDAISRMVNLEELSLGQGPYTSLPVSLQQLTKLWKLELFGLLDPEYSQGILEVIYLINSLTHLQLYSMGLREITENIQYLSELRSLTLSNAGLKKISPSIGTLNKLETLAFMKESGVGSKDIIVLPVKDDDLKSLVYLDLSATAVRKLPDDFFRRGVTVKWPDGSN